MRISRIHALNLLCIILSFGLSLHVRFWMEPRNRAAMCYLWRRLLAMAGLAW